MTTYICKCGRRVKKSTMLLPPATAWLTMGPAMNALDAPMPRHTETFNGTKVLELSSGRLGATSAG